MSPSLRAALERWVTARWYAHSPGALWLLFPLEVLFRGITALRRALYAYGLLSSVRLSVPVVVVGNIVAGGSGKTPVIAALSRLLQEHGYRPGIVSRGYGRQSTDTRWVSPSSRVEEVGDEPLLLARETTAPVLVARQRGEGAQRLLEAGCDVVLADDGLQHYALSRDLEIAVIPAKRRHGNGHLIPVGPLREPVSRLQAADFRVVVNGAGAAGEYALQGRPGNLVPLRSDRPARALADLAGQDVLAIAAIAHPEGFFDSLEAAGLNAETRRFADHHAFTPADFAEADPRPLVMTTKDAVKCAFLRRREAYALEYTVTLPQAFANALLDRLAAIATQKQGMNTPDAG